MNYHYSQPKQDEFRIFFKDWDTVIVPKDIPKLIKQLQRFNKDGKEIERVYDWGTYG